MSHFAKLDENNLVTFVTVGRQEDDGLEAELTARTGDVSGSLTMKPAMLSSLQSLLSRGFSMRALAYGLHLSPTLPRVSMFGMKKLVTG